ncbi:MAG: enoyl-CoA hydratase/isomerase family protein [Deltaproteobacteria bacterium]|nr:enoyl-CoA hydratase/isomerase family protein [Deltaproteobacteria bacterium]
MRYETLTLADDGRVATLTLDRPEAGNATNMKMVRELVAACEHLADHSKAEVLVLRGAGGVFCAGIDLADFEPGHAADIHGFHKWEQACTAIEKLPKITIAQINGECVGGGAQLALVCDFRLMARGARIGFNEVRLGFIPGLATFRLAKFIGLGRAKSIVLTSRMLDAEEAERIGLVDRLYDPTDADAALAKTIEGFLPFNSVSLELTRRLMNESYAVEYEDFVGHFLAAQHRSISDEPFAAHIAKARTKISD